MRFKTTHFLLLFALFLSVSTRLFSNSNDPAISLQLQNHQKGLSFLNDHSTEEFTGFTLSFNAEKDNQFTGFNWSLYENEEDEEFFSFKKYLNEKTGITLCNSVKLYGFFSYLKTNLFLSLVEEKNSYLSSPFYIAYRIIRI